MNSVFLKNFSIVLILLIIVAFIITCDQTRDNTVLATFKGGSIVESEYINHYLESTKYKPNEFPTRENLQRIVTLKAIEKLSVLEALDRNINEDSVFINNYAKVANKTLFYQYMRQEIINSVITDSLMKKFYTEFSPQYKMRYIMRPVVKSSTLEFAVTQKDTIEFVYKLLESGQKFEILAEKYSQDITTNKKGGDLGFVIRESLGDSVLRAVMDTLPEFTYSKPFRGYEGFYILYKEEKREVPIPAFASVQDRIWKTLYRTRRHNIKEAAEQRFTMLAARYNYTVHNDVINLVRKKAGSNVTDLKIISLDFEKLTGEDLNNVIAEYDNGIIRLSELFIDPKKAPLDLLEFEEYLSIIAQQHLFAKHALELGFHKLPEITQQLEKVRQSLLANYLFQKEVKDKAIAAFDSLKNDADLKKIELTKNRFDLEKEVQKEYENYLKIKYNFRFKYDNFDKAISRANIKKEEQNKES